MTDDETTVPADQPDPPYVDDTEEGPITDANGDELDHGADDPEPMMSGAIGEDTDPEAETAPGSEPNA